ncbi:hypothetical protein M422DRAFT_180403, partial [Sphaerobolus stellatus SS14]
FSRLNFIYTLLSKRKLRWFIEQGLVRGWDDARFPTVRGIRRRGLTVEALRQYMLSQGPSQAVVSLEWDSIWAINKKVIDPVAPRFWATEKENTVKLTLNGNVPVEIKQNPRHKKNPDVGVKDTVYAPVILIEQKDALSFAENEEITLMDWGNAIIRSKSTSSDGTVTSLTADLHLEGDFRKTDKKITWLADPESSKQPLISVTLLDYDYLITKKKLEEDDDVANFVTPVTEFKVDAWADKNVATVKQGDFIQFERKGYYRVDAVRGEGENLHLDFVHIPDGKAAGLASKNSPVAAPEVGKKGKKGGEDKGANGDENKGGKGKESKAAGKDKSSSDAPTPNQTSTGSERTAFSNATKGFAIPITTKMYNVARVYGEEPLNPTADTKMYSVQSVYEEA